MDYEAKNYENLLGLPGFDDELLNNHLSLYQGYVKNTNALIEVQKKLHEEGKAEKPDFSETKRRFGWEFNGMRLHEYYFENLSKTPKPLDEESKIFAKIKETFGSFEAWEQDFRVTGLMRGVGWVILYYDMDRDRLFNVWIGEHNVNHLSGTKPLLVMDVWEHAYMTQYGIKRADYIEAFLKAVDWQMVGERFGE